jgi:hypothetical protein
VFCSITGTLSSCDFSERFQGIDVDPNKCFVSLQTLLLCLSRAFQFNHWLLSWRPGADLPDFGTRTPPRISSLLAILFNRQAESPPPLHPRLHSIYARHLGALKPHRRRYRDACAWLKVTIGRKGGVGIHLIPARSPSLSTPCKSPNCSPHSSEAPSIAHSHKKGHKSSCQLHT